MYAFSLKATLNADGHPHVGTTSLVALGRDIYLLHLCMHHCTLIYLATSLNAFYLEISFDILSRSKQYPQSR